MAQQEKLSEKLEKSHCLQEETVLILCLDSVTLHCYVDEQQVFEERLTGNINAEMTLHTTILSRKFPIYIQCKAAAFFRLPFLLFLMLKCPTEVFPWDVESQFRLGSPPQATKST